MGIFSILILAIGLSMDAFAVSVCKGLALRKIGVRECAIVGLWFGGFQGLMPLLGYFLGIQFSSLIQEVDHYIAFVLLAVIGGNMLREALSSKDDEEKEDASLGWKTMLVMAIATSIDALAIGVTFAFLEVNIVYAVCLIGITTFLLSAAGVKIGNVFGVRYKSKAEIAGGVILILLGVKILVEHLGIVPALF